MVAYSHFFGIDIGKFNFVVSRHGLTNTTEYKNSSVGIKQFIKAQKQHLANALCVVETTGGYELDLVYALVAAGFKVHRADAKQVKYFIRSLGNKAKTDTLDAKALAYYAYERGARLEVFQPRAQEYLDLFKLVQRRGDLNQTLVAEKNRLKSPHNQAIKQSIIAVIACIETQLANVTGAIKQIIAINAILNQKQAVLKSIPGVGEIVSFELMTLLPELGELSRTKIAALAGVAPMANDSGTTMGYRHTRQGRQGIKRILFIAALAASRSNSQLKEFYQRLLAKGKKKMVALTALMRKILVIANAKLKELLACQPREDAVVMVADHSTTTHQINKPQHQAYNSGANKANKQGGKVTAGIAARPVG